MAALDSRQFLHKAIYDIMLLSYNDTTNNAVSGFAFLEVVYFEQAGVCIDITFDFDVITSKDTIDIMGYLDIFIISWHSVRTNHQSVMMNFANFVGMCPHPLIIVCG